MTATTLLPANTLHQLLALGRGMGQLTDERAGNLGFGQLYYSLTRLERPAVVVCIGSYRGFAPVCFTLGLADNRHGCCYFIDPGKVDHYWHDPATFARLEQTFGLRGHWHHLRQTTQQVVAAASIPAPIDMLYIDGDHSYEGVKFDFDQLGKQVRPGGLIMLHDSTAVGKGFTRWEVKRFLEAEVYGRAGYETFTFPFAAGLTLVRKLR